MSFNNKTKDDESIKVIPGAYRERLTYLRKAQEYSSADEIPRAVENYGKYLNALALFYKVEEAGLNPKMFDQEKDLPELFLISHAYWDLAKAYDRSPNLHLESIRCLDQFVKFTIGYKYQYVNARTIKAFIKKRLAHNPKAFKEAFERINIESKGCFIASDLYGEHHPKTYALRAFKTTLLKTEVGLKAIDFYYNSLCPFYFKLKKIPGFSIGVLFVLDLVVVCIKTFRWRNFENN